MKKNIFHQLCLLVSLVCTFNLTHFLLGVDTVLSVSSEAELMALITDGPTTPPETPEDQAQTAALTAETTNLLQQTTASSPIQSAPTTSGLSTSGKIAIGASLGAVAGAAVVGATAAGIKYAIDQKKIQESVRANEKAKATASMNKFGNKVINGVTLKKLALNDFLFSLGMDPLDRLKPEELVNTFPEIEARIQDGHDATLRTGYARALFALIDEAKGYQFARDLLDNIKKIFIDNARIFDSEQIEVYFVLCVANKLPFPTDSRQLQGKMGIAREALAKVKTEYENAKQLAQQIANTNMSFWRRAGGWLWGTRTIPQDLVDKANIMKTSWEKH